MPRAQTVPRKGLDAQSVINHPKCECQARQEPTVDGLQAKADYRGLTTTCHAVRASQNGKENNNDIKTTGKTAMSCKLDIYQGEIDDL